MCYLLKVQLLGLQSKFPCRGKCDGKGKIGYVKTKVEALEACSGSGPEPMENCEVCGENY
jgi:hypothetical protein